MDHVEGKDKKESDGRDPPQGVAPHARGISNRRLGYYFKGIMALVFSFEIASTNVVSLSTDHTLILALLYKYILTKNSEKLLN